MNRALAPVSTLGPGSRLGLWVQGCTLACPGCASQDTWDTSRGSWWSVGRLVGVVEQEIQRSGITALSVTGGEPLQQADAVAELLRAVRPLLTGGVPVLLFTGYAPTAARARAPWLDELCDVVIAGRYRPELAGPHALVATSNQTVLCRDDSVRQEFMQWQDSVPNRLEVTVDDHDLYLVGVPRPGDLPAFEQAMARRGVHFSSLTWRT